LTTNPKRGRGRLRVVQPADPPPDDRVQVARELLRRYAPTEPVVLDEALAFLGWNTPALTELQSDPRYQIGRLTQALSALLRVDVPPPDAVGRLLIEAIGDAIHYRQIQCCGGECEKCRPEWIKADLYMSLYGQLGLIEEWPVRRPELR
jgi:hypothetical protein